MPIDASETTAVHLLSAPRSASSLIAAALGQHPSLFLCPEVNFWMYPTIGRMIEHDHLAYYRTGEHASISAGLLRVVSELEKDLRSPQRRYDWLVARSSWSPSATASHIAKRLAPRLPLYKSARLSLSPTGLTRLQSSAGKIRVIHLVRHPLLVIASLIRTNPTQENADLHAETWLHANHCINELAASLADDQLLLVRAEQILRSPIDQFETIGKFLQLDTSAAAIAAMLRPQDSPYARPMDDRLHFYLNPAITANPRIYNRRQQPPLTQNLLGRLKQHTIEKLSLMAERFGYNLRHPDS